MLTYDIDKRGSLPIYDYLYRCIKNDIITGRLKSNEKLPSKRRMAEHNNISVITVENAYAQLILEGYIFAVQKKGYFVSPLDEEHYTGAHIPVEEAEKEEDSYILDLKTNSISPEKFPFSIWSRLMRETLSVHDTELLKASPHNGMKPLREAIAEHLYHFRGMIVSPAQIIVGAGTEHLYTILIQLLGRGRIFAVENPGYRKVPMIYKSNGVKCEYINLDELGLSVKELEKTDASVVHISPSHHFPTGIVMPISRRYETLKWAIEQNDRYIIEDDYDSEFRFAGRPVQPLKSIDEHERVIYINTFSKTIAPSIRISYMILPAHLMKRYSQQLGFYSCAVPSFEQLTLARFISGGYFEKHISRMKNYYKAQRDIVIRAIQKSPFSNLLTIKEKDAGLHFLIEVKTEKTDSLLIEELKRAGIKISCLSEYLNEPDDRFLHTLVVNYSGIDSSRLGEAISRLEQVIRDKHKGRIE